MFCLQTDICEHHNSFAILLETFRTIAY